MWETTHREFAAQVGLRPLGGGGRSDRTRRGLARLRKGGWVETGTACVAWDRHIVRVRIADGKRPVIAEAMRAADERRDAVRRKRETAAAAGKALPSGPPRVHRGGGCPQEPGPGRAYDEPTGRFHWLDGTHTGIDPCPQDPDIPVEGRVYDSVAAKFSWASHPSADALLQVGETPFASARGREIADRLSTDMDDATAPLDADLAVAAVPGPIDAGVTPASRSAGLKALFGLGEGRTRSGPAVQNASPREDA